MFWMWFAGWGGKVECNMMVDKRMGGEAESGGVEGRRSAKMKPTVIQILMHTFGPKRIRSNR